MFGEIRRAVADEEEIEQISADGSYHWREVYDALSERAIRRAAIPPRRGGKIWQHGNSSKERVLRDEKVRAVRKKGRAKWKREANYHRRSLAETGVYRFKTIITEKLQWRKQDNEFQEMINK